MDCLLEVFGILDETWLNQACFASSRHYDKKENGNPALCANFATTYPKGVWFEGPERREQSPIVATKLCHYDFLPWVMQACDLSDTYALGRAKAYKLLCNV
jgi:hypothetical protein